MMTCRGLPLSMPGSSAFLSIAGKPSMDEAPVPDFPDGDRPRRRRNGLRRSFLDQRRHRGQRAAELLVAVEGRRKFLHLIAPDAQDLAPEPASPSGEVGSQQPVAHHAEGIDGMAGAGAGFDQDQALRPHPPPARRPSCRNSCPSRRPDPAAPGPDHPASRRWPARRRRSPRSR